MSQAKIIYRKEVGELIASVNEILRKYGFSNFDERRTLIFLVEPGEDEDRIHTIGAMGWEEARKIILAAAGISP